ncbi:YfhO family protein [Streptococcus pseudoporcinus]|uniref:Bacterial membrane protein YfhO n=1 Tax=Streptococcus pseudoporcinus LQ 940-04 TaxID=875093 RepID=G5K7C7_9STRE|nr:YfhO family protein [Streptococcus pseudoporcinus]EHI64561.1 bacterial membrane protein YfhO [Streptococcus pseudoporcinus LQ 940-04]VEF93848.1 membrane protein [Streptococcus pseudoporcinus]
MIQKKYISTLLIYLASFILPTLIMFTVLFSKGIYWGSSKTILASDGFHQYVIFAQALRNILHGSDSIFYTFTSGLGLNFYALISYYLGSFFSPFVYFFDLTSMPDAIYLFTLLKFGLIGLSTYFSLHHIYSKVKPYLILSLSTTFALMSFLTSQLEINTWLDVFILVPLIILGLHRLLNQKIGFYYFTLTILFIQNYYFAYMVSIFLTVYLLIQLLNQESCKQGVKTFLRFVTISILSALSASFMLLPTYLDLRNQGEKFTAISKLITENSWSLDLLSKSILGTYDTTKFNAIPMIFVGLLPLLLTILYFTIRSIKWQVKVAYLIFIVFICLSYYFQPLDLFWQAMHAPNMFLHRYAWTIPLLLVLLSCETLTHIEDLSINKIVFAFTILSLALASPYLFLEHYSFLSPNLFFLTIAFLTAYTIILLSLEEFKFPIIIIVIFTLIFTTLESTLNTYYVITGLENEWVFPTRQGYNQDLHAINHLVKKQNKVDTDFYRTERILPQTGNDSMKFNYHGISQFSSIRNRLSSKVLDRLGFKSEGTNLNLRYQNNTLIADSLFAVKYNLSESENKKFGFTKVNQIDNINLYKNNYALPLAIMTSGKYFDTNFTVNTLDNQTRLLNQLSGKNYTYFTEQNAHLISKENVVGKRISKKAETNAEDTVVSYRLKIPENKQMYLSLPNISFENQQEKNVLVTINGKTSHYTTDNTFTFFDLGYFKDEQIADIHIIFPKNKSISFDSPHFYSLDITNYKKAFSTIKNREITVRQNQNKLTLDYQTTTKSSILLTLPYDQGWSAKHNNKSVVIRKAQKGFMAIDVPKGKGKIYLTFIPKGFKEGLVVSLIAFVTFSIHFILKLMHSKKSAL